MPAIKHLETLMNSDYFHGIGLPCVVREMRYAPSNTFVAMHDHEFSEIVIVMAGKINHIHKYNTDRLSKGDFFVIHPGEQHGYAELSMNTVLFNVLYHATDLPSQIAVGGFPLIKTFFPSDINSSSAKILGHIPPSHLSTIGQLIKMISREEHSKNALRHTVCESLFATLLLYLSRYSLNAETSLRDTPLKLETDFISANLERKITISQLCSISGKSASTLHREFKKHIGKSPGDYIISLRVKKAKSLLLTTSLSMSEIAYQTGFCGQGHLSRTLNK
jgi:AraC-like DNA-binding protein